MLLQLTKDGSGSVSPNWAHHPSTCDKNCSQLPTFQKPTPQTMGWKKSSEPQSNDKKIAIEKIVDIKGHKI